MDRKVVLVTGANRGIGFEFCKQFGKKGYDIILTARDPDKGASAIRLLAAAGIEGYLGVLNVINEEDIKLAVEYVESQFGKLDILINNAGVNIKDYELSELSFDNIMEVIKVNSIAPVIMVKNFVGLLKKGKNSKIINISSSFGSISHKVDREHYAYCASKTALNMFNKIIACDLKKDGILSVVLHPGWVQTDMGGKEALLKPEESVEGMIEVIDYLTIEDTGRFFQWNEKEVSW